MVFSIKTKKSQRQQQLIDTMEAFNLWDILRSKYTAVDRMKTWQNFVHDSDLLLLIKYHIKEFQENIGILEGLAKKYSVKTADQNRAYMKTPTNPEIVNDEFISHEIFIFIQEHVENLLKIFRTSFTNDNFRKTVRKMTEDTLNLEGKTVKYLKLKGWIVTPPIYPNVPDEVNEKITTSEAYNLWDHLAIRYDNIYQTRLFHSFAHDGDFKLILDMGLNQLTRQARILQKELEHFGINLPRRPAEVIPMPENTELLDDDYMYRILLIGLQGALILHASALKQCTLNDRIRSLFKKLLLDEVEYLDRFIKLGKLKGWQNVPPQYRI